MYRTGSATTPLSHFSDYVTLVSPTLIGVEGYVMDNDFNTGILDLLPSPALKLGDMVYIRNNGTGVFGPYRDTKAEVVRVKGFLHLDNIETDGTIGRIISSGWHYDVKLYDGNVMQYDGLSYGSLELIAEAEVPHD